MYNITFIFPIKDFENPSEGHFFEHLFLIRTAKFKNAHDLLTQLGEKREDDIVFTTVPDKYVKVSIRNITKEQLEIIEEEYGSWYSTVEDFEVEKRVFEIESVYTRDDAKDFKSMFRSKVPDCFDYEYVSELTFEPTIKKFSNYKPEVFIYRYNLVFKMNLFLYMIKNRFK